MKLRMTPIIYKALMGQPLDGGPPFFSMHLITEGGAIRKKMVVKPTSQAWKIIQQSEMPNNKDYHAAYAWCMLKKHGLEEQFQSVIATANKEKLDILTTAFREIKFLNALEEK